MQLQSHAADPENPQAGKAMLAQANSRRALGDLSNLVGGFKAVNVGKDAAQGRTGVLTRRAAAQLAAEVVDPNGATTKGNVDSWGGGKPRNGLRPRDANVPAHQTEDKSALQPQRSHSQLLQARSEVAIAAGQALRAAAESLPDIDEEDKNDPLAATDYVKDIFAYYRRIEPFVRVGRDYMSRQMDINDKMRAILVDWLVDVHLKFKLMPETLYLTVNLIDRFLELKSVTRKHLQLVGVTAMLVASKYEEIWAPEVRDFVYISDRAYTRDQILNMEKIMLNVLRFNLTVPTPFSFLNRFFKAAGILNDKQVVHYATFLVELALPEYGMLRYTYSQLAAAAIYAANATLGLQAYSPTLARHSGFSEAQAHECACWLVDLHRKSSLASLTAVYKKFSNDKFLGVAKIPPLAALTSQV